MWPNERCTRSTVYDSSSQKLWCPILVKRTAAATTLMTTTAASSGRVGPASPPAAARLGCAPPRPARPLGRGTPGRDVQAHVVDLHRVTHAVGDGVHIPCAQRLRQLLEVMAEADGAD